MKHKSPNTTVEKSDVINAIATHQSDSQKRATPSNTISTAHECCRYKATPRSTQLQADIQKRINRAIGQLNGVKTMLDENRYCGDVLTQLSAVESAVRRISEMLLAEHMQTCVIEEIRKGNDEVIDEAIALMRRLR